MTALSLLKQINDIPPPKPDQSYRFLDGIEPIKRQAVLSNFVGMRNINAVIHNILSYTDCSSPRNYCQIGNQIKEFFIEKP